VEYLKENHIIENLHKELINPETKLNQKRAYLWALGNIGSTELGMAYLIKTEKLAQTILDMTLNSEHLPLKGVCLNVANMFAQTPSGRQTLKENKWQISSLKQNEYSESEFIAVPPSLNQFLSIPKQSKTHFPFQLNEQYWTLYIKIMNTIRDGLDEKGKEFHKELMKMTVSTKMHSQVTHINNWLQKSADSQLCKNTKLFYLMLVMLTFHSFPLAIRRSFFNVMEYFLNVPNFLVLLDEDKDFADLLSL
jgi:hypothetical protein